MSKSKYERRIAVEEAIEGLAENYKNNKIFKWVVDNEYDSLMKTKLEGYKLTKIEEIFISSYQEYDIKRMMASYFTIMNEPVRIAEKSLVTQFKQGLEKLINKKKIKPTNG